MKGRPGYKVLGERAAISVNRLKSSVLKVMRGFMPCTFITATIRAS